MLHETGLIALISVGFVLALAFGYLALRLRLPPIVGYLLAGVAVGPFTPGFVGDSGLAAQLAEIGVILLMFGVGLHFSIETLLKVKRIAVPGAIVQIVFATAIGAAIASWWGWGLGAGLVFGLALSVASTVVLLRALTERNELDSENGRIAVGWLIIEDLVTVLALVFLPALAGTAAGEHSDGAHSGGLLMSFAITIGKVAVFMVLMLVGGKRLVPWLLAQVARTGSRELFTLAVLAFALGIAFGSAYLFDVSFALGAFFAGVLLSESDLSHQAAADSLPLQDAFAVLFFVSVGMLFDPSILSREPGAVLAVLAIIVVGKSLAAFLIVLAFRYPIETALTVSAGLAQIGEFSFILAGLGVTLGLLPAEGRDLILAGALLSIALNSLVFATIKPVVSFIKSQPGLARVLDRPALRRAQASARAHDNELSNHAVLIGHGRVGSFIGRALNEAGLPYVVIEKDLRIVESLRKQGIGAIYGDASTQGVLEAANVIRAKLLIIATPDGFQARRILELAQRKNPSIVTAVRTHSESELRYLEQSGVGRAVMAEREVALGMTEYALNSLGVDEEKARMLLQQIRAFRSEGT
jgi:CPA2 family monovalent cation:H+ antiporter-2